MKTVGMLLICFAGLGYGMYSRAWLYRRATMLERIVQWLMWSAEHIRYTAAPLGEVLRAAKRTSEFEMLPFLNADTRDTVCAQIREYRTTMALNEEDVRLLCECVDGFGEADLTGEIHRLRQYGTLFERRWRDARDDAIRRGRLFVTLGVCGGGAVALLLGG